MCVIQKLAQVDFEPGDDCKKCKVNKECIELILHIAAKCVDLIHRLEATEKTKKGMH